MKKSSKLYLSEIKHWKMDQFYWWYVAWYLHTNWKSQFFKYKNYENSLNVKFLSLHPCYARAFVNKWNLFQKAFKKSRSCVWTKHISIFFHDENNFFLTMWTVIFCRRQPFFKFYWEKSWFLLFRADFHAITLTCK